MIPLSYKREAHLANGSRVVNKLVPEQFCYTSIIETIKSLFQVKEFASCILNKVIDRSAVYASGVYESFKDGSCFQTHKLFSNASKVVLRIQIFYDGMGTTNPLRGHSAPHNLGIFYFTIQNLPNYFTSCFPSTHCFAMCYTFDLKTNGFKPILSKFMDELNFLETGGIHVSVPEMGDVLIFGSISQFTGDCLATNEIFGLVEDFSHDYYFPHCNCTRDSISKKFNENDFIFRGKIEHAKDLENLEKAEGSVLHIRGQKRDSVLNRSKYYHTSESRTIDIMHILPEGILNYVMSCIIFEFIHIRKKITLEMLNARLLNMFSVLEVEKGNTPAQLNDLKAPGTGLSPKLTANESLSLFCHLAYVLSILVEDEDTDNNWRLLVQLEEITDIVFAPKLTESLLNYFS